MLRQVSQASPEVVIVPGVTQYSVAHCVTQGPPVAHTHLEMMSK